MTPAYPRVHRPVGQPPEGDKDWVLVVLATCAAVVIGAVVVVGMGALAVSSPTQSVRYLGVYEPDAPHSYAGLDQFAQAIGRQPNLVIYYSHWLDPFQTSFATSAAKHGATTLVQMDAEECFAGEHRRRAVRRLPALLRHSSQGVR